MKRRKDKEECTERRAKTRCGNGRETGVEEGGAMVSGKGRKMSEVWRKDNDKKQEVSVPSRSRRRPRRHPPSPKIQIDGFILNRDLVESCVCLRIKRYHLLFKKQNTRYTRLDCVYTMATIT